MIIISLLLSEAKSKADAIAAVEHMIDGGIYNIEITFTTPQAEEVIQHLSQYVIDENVVIGAGTVLDSTTARLAIFKWRRICGKSSF